MIRGIYTAAAGLDTDMDRIDIVANNIANIDTIGFKKDVYVTKSFSTMLGNMMVSETPVTDKVKTVYSQGDINYSGNPFDFAIDGNGFFAVQTDQGIGYTRRGVFRTNGEHTLVTSDGHPVLADGQEIKIPEGAFFIHENGDIQSDGKFLGKLQLVDFPQPYALSKQGGNLFYPDQGVQSVPSKAVVRQYYLEESNVSSLGAVIEMMALMNTMRHSESQQKIIQLQDETLQKVIDEVGRV